MSPRTRLQGLLAVCMAVGAFIAWDTQRHDTALAEVAEAVPRALPVTAADPPAPPQVSDPALAGPREAAAPTHTAPSDLFRPRHRVATDAVAPGDVDDAHSARVVGVAQTQGGWVALVEHGGQIHWLAAGMSVGGLRVDRVASHDAHMTDLTHGTSHHLDLSPAGPIAGVQARSHED